MKLLKIFMLLSIINILIADKKITKDNQGYGMYDIILNHFLQTSQFLTEAYYSFTLFLAGIKSLLFNSDEDLRRHPYYQNHSDKMDKKSNQNLFDQYKEFENFTFQNQTVNDNDKNKFSNSSVFIRKNSFRSFCENNKRNLVSK